MLTVTHLARKAQVTADTIRHYIQIGLLKPSRLVGNNYQIFSNADAQRLRFIQQAKLLGFSLKDIKCLLEQAEQGHSPCPLARDLLRQRLVENKKKLEQLQILQNRLERCFNAWQNMPDGVPDGDRVCHLIESLSE